MSHSPFDGELLSLAWQHQSSDGLMQHQIKIIPISTGKGYETSDCLRLRAICHLLLDYLPEEALEEAKNFLLEAVKFYREPQPLSEAFQPRDSFEVAIGEGYERPIFQIAED